MGNNDTEEIIEVETFTSPSNYLSNSVTYHYLSNKCYEKDKERLFERGGDVTIFEDRKCIKIGRKYWIADGEPLIYKTEIEGKIRTVIEQRYVYHSKREFYPDKYPIKDYAFDSKILSDVFKYQNEVKLSKSKDEKITTTSKQIN